jgi:hypothetical protein
MFFGIVSEILVQPGAGRDGEDHAARQLFVRFQIMVRLLIKIILFNSILIISVTIMGCCVSHNLTILNETDHDIAVVSGHTQVALTLKANSQKKLPHMLGSLAIISGDKIWIYDHIDVTAFPDAKEKYFKFGICQCGFGYITTKASFDENGIIRIGKSTINPEKKIEWNKTEQRH